MSLIESIPPQLRRTSHCDTWSPSKVGQQAWHDCMIWVAVQRTLQLEHLRREGNIALLLQLIRVLLLPNKVERYMPPDGGLMSDTVLVGRSDGHLSSVNRRHHLWWRHLYHFFRDAIKRCCLVSTEAAKVPKIIVTADIARERPRRAIGRAQLCMGRNESGMKSRHSMVVSASAIIRVIDRTKDLAHPPANLGRVLFPRPVHRVITCEKSAHHS